MNQIFKQIARQNAVSPEEVETEILMAIQTGMKCPDADVQRRWATVPREKDMPTAEEVIAFIMALTQQVCCLSDPSESAEFTSHQPMATIQ